MWRAYGTETSTQRLIKLGRKGNGVVGWNLDTEEVSNGAGCEDTESLRVREAWWELVGVERER
ncbi:hypothetical protein [Streptomyces sp. NPDC021622]|uniref:hypothetical protein n=1 Tax=Streptomyces sp. NPDC021622 TaxID=3155013 RepID=UPI0034036E35